ncbi:MAG: hypothetical protein IJB79_04090 [Candidatus Gastranaerophilales bacterium]|nr:hypothetical protein [Candidatus Gastranaerophilales bacterium]
MEDKIFKYGKDITWSLPLMFQYEPVWGTIVKLFKMFGIDVPPVNGFGCPKMAWFGGRRPNITEEIEPMALLKIFNYCKEVGITPSFTFTRTQLTKDDLNDKYANYLLDMALEFKAHFIVYSELLKNYIKEKDPNAYMVASVIKSQEKFQGENAKNWSVENETNHYNKLLKEYDLVVVRPEYSMGPLLENPSLLDDISRVEILVNQRCVKNCPKAMEHYRVTEDCIEENGVFQCVHDEITDGKIAYNSCVSHDRKTIEKLVGSGVKHIKLQGRGLELSTLSMALLLFTRIFEVEGKNFLVQERLMSGAAEMELEQFAAYLNNQF